MVGVPEILCPHDDGPPAVLARPFGEARGKGAPESRIRERLAEGDPHWREADHDKDCEASVGMTADEPSPSRAQGAPQRTTFATRAWPTLSSPCWRIIEVG